jgi:MFS family permease
MNIQLPQVHIRLPEWYTGNVPWLFATRIVRSFSQALLVIIVPLYVAAAGYSTLQIGYLLSIALAGSTGLTILVGFFSDRYGRKLLLIVIAGMAGIGSLVYALTTQFWVLCLMAALASIRGGGAGSGGGFGPFYPAEQALVAGSAKDKERNAVFSSLSLVGVLAGAAGSAVAVLPGTFQQSFKISVLDSYRPMFWIAAISAAVVIILILPIHEQHTAPAPTKPNEAPARITAQSLIGRLWITNGINGFVMGVVGPFLTYWLALRYGATSTQIATLYLVANLLTAASYLAAPVVAYRLGSVRAIVFSRLGSVVFMAGLALAPTFILASLAYTLRVMVNSLGMPIRQSFVMGVAEEQNRSKVAAIGSLPSQAIGMIAPTVASQIVLGVSEAAPIWMATAALAVNAGLFELFFKNVRPPEEE